MTAKPLLVLGTGNRKKGLELAGLLQGVGVDIRTLSDFPQAISVPEDGQTFAENAALKATRQAIHLGHWVLAEDSGLMVDALDGAPGVFSARFSGTNANDESNNRLLLQRLAGTPLENRSAGYVCHLALSDPAGKLRAENKSSCRGRIALQPQGTHGFGYDPLFEVVEYHRTFGILGPVVKACLSHRARAVRKLIPNLMQLVDSGSLA